jgi:hypothetical protein
MYYSTIRYYQKLTIDHTKVPADTTSVSVILTGVNFNNDIKTTAGAIASRSDGGDLRFFSDATLNTPLAFDLITYTQNATPANAQIEVVVNVTAVSSSVDTPIYVGWGDPSMTVLPKTDTYGAYSAYDAGFKLWCPMKDDPDTSHVKDRTTNQLSGTKQGAASPAQSTASPEYTYENELFVNASGNYIQFPAVTTGNQFTVFLPFNYTNASGGHGYQRIVSNKTAYNATSGFEVNLLSASNTQIQVIGSSATEYDPTVFTNIVTDGWETTAVRFNGTQVDVFVNTTKTTNATAVTSVTNNTNALTIGDNAALNEATLDAHVDNIIIYSGALTDAEIQTMQNNQRAPSTFINSVGTTHSTGPLWSNEYIISHRRKYLKV